MSLEFSSSILDPIHDLVRLTAEERKPIDYPIFQRLRETKQNGLLRLVRLPRRRTRIKSGRSVRRCALYNSTLRSCPHEQRVERRDRNETGTERARFFVLRNLGTVRTCHAHLNIYFDQEWRLATRAATCRIRIGAGRAHLTIKLPTAFSGEPRAMREVEIPLENRHGTTDDGRLGCHGGMVSVLNETFHRIFVTSCGSSVLSTYSARDGREQLVHRQLTDFIRSLAPSASLVHISKFERFRRALTPDTIRKKPPVSR